MLGLEVLAFVLTAIPMLLSTDTSKSLTKNVLGPARKYRQQRFSVVPRALHYLSLFGTENIQELHKNINEWKDEDVKAWKEAYIGSCNAITVAGAIFAGISLTSLQLPSIRDICWIVQALFSASMLFGILSVVAATSQHHEIGSIDNPMAIRLHLSRGKPSVAHFSRLEAYDYPFNTFPLESSVSAYLLTQFPRVLLSLAGASYLVGFSLYLILSWERGPMYNRDLRNTLFFLIVLMGASILCFLVCYAYRVVEAAKVSNDFHTQRLGTTFGSSEDLQELKTKLADFHQGKDIAVEVRRLTAEMVRLRESLPRNANTGREVEATA